ncbi:MAG: GH3 auxin-responsive promoter family protein [Bacteroidales bacterium]|nr:GH3 auxin-responsive promoter family protein [Bacteroidales bacterium]
MPTFGRIIKRPGKRRKNLMKASGQYSTLQEISLIELLKKAQNTKFGKHYRFKGILNSENIIDSFRTTVPIFDYETIYKDWWHQLLEGKNNVCWPGKVNYFALTSGTANDSSKRVPVTGDMISAMRKTALRQLLVLGELKLPSDLFQKSLLMVGGSTSLVRKKGYFEGDLSGIMARKMPKWAFKFYKPGLRIARERNWRVKLYRITRRARRWDVLGVAGTPSWIQMMLEQIVEYYGLKNIHELWPDLIAYSWGGVSLDPYRSSFEKLLGKPICYLETYLASEGFLAYQPRSYGNMQLVVDNGIFFEFIPYNDNNFLPDGSLNKNPQVLLLPEIEAGVDYALLISTCAGAWRYLIGDTIRFLDTERYEMMISGRTRHTLNLCGEHLSVDNMNMAIKWLSQKFSLEINEYTVAGIRHNNYFAHKWYIGVKNGEIPGIKKVRQELDKKLMELNDDYRTERSAALKEIFVELLPVSTFYDFLRQKGKEGGQHKFPRVINHLKDEWELFLNNTRPSIRVDSKI